MKDKQLKALWHRLIFDTTFRELIGNSVVALLVRLVGIGLGLAFTAAIGRGLGPDGVGFFSLLFATIATFSVISRIGLDTLIIRLIPGYTTNGDKDAKNKTYSLAFKCIIVVALACSAILAIMGYFAKLLNWRPSLFLVIAIALPLHALLLLNVAALKAEKKIPFAAILEHGILWPLLLLFYILRPQNSSISTTGYIVYLPAIFLSYIFGQVLVQKIAGYKLDLKMRCSIRNFIDQISKSYPMLIASLITILLVSSELWILAFFTGKGPVGIYTVANRLASLVSFPLAAIINIASPKFAEVAAKSYKTIALKEVAEKATRLSVWGAMPFFLVLFIFPKYFLSIFGTKFLIAQNILYILLIGQMVNVLVGPVGHFLWMTGYAQKFQFIMFISLIVSLIGNLIMVPMMGITGAAIINVIVMIVKNCLCWRLINKEFSINMFYFPIYLK